jgi:hypothetical protein
MHVSLKKRITGVTLGIKYERTFRIPDIAGNMIDDILHDKNSPFSVKGTFPKILESPKEKALYNPENNDYLRVNTDDIILRFSIKDNFEKRYKWLVAQVIKYYKDNLFKKETIASLPGCGMAPVGHLLYALIGFRGLMLQHCPRSTAPF